MQINPCPDSYYRSTTMVPWIPEPSTVNNKLKRREGSGSTGRLFTVEGSGIQGTRLLRLPVARILESTKTELALENFDQSLT